MVGLASQPGASVTQIACEYDINANIIFKWLKLWQNEGHTHATVAPASQPVLLPFK